MDDNLDKIIDNLTEEELNNLNEVLKEYDKIKENNLELDNKKEIEVRINKLELTGCKDTNVLIFNLLDLNDLIALNLTSKGLKNELKDILLHCQITILCAETLTDIIKKNDENREVAEHLLVEMYYGIKKSQSK